LPSLVEGLGGGHSLYILWNTWDKKNPFFF
jgi:hypothetical protein